MSEDPTGRLLAQVASGDRAAFAALYRQAAPKLAGVLMRILGNRSEVDDALQEVFIRVWSRAAQFSAGRGNGMSWMVAVARNHALDRLRSRPEARGLRQDVARDDEGQDPLDRIAAPGAGPEALLVAGGEARRVVECFEELEVERAQAVRGAYLEGLSYQDLAARHGIPLNTVRTWLRRGLIRLRECLDR